MESTRLMQHSDMDRNAKEDSNLQTVDGPYSATSIRPMDGQSVSSMNQDGYTCALFIYVFGELT